MAGLDSLFLGVDGGGSGCRVRLVDDYGRELGAGVGGTTNIRSGLEAAWASILGATDTALEGLLSARIEGTRDDGMQWRVKLGGGGGLDPHFGAPQWRLLFAVEVFNRRSKPSVH